MADCFDAAQVCLNGHITNSAYNNKPALNTPHCVKCGAKTITVCTHCNSYIRGTPIIGNKLGWSISSAPNCCYACGKYYPWTESTIKAAKELAQEIEGLSESEKDILSKSIDDLILDTPQTTVAAVRFKKYVMKAGRVIADGLRDILVNVVSETAKKTIWG